MSVSSMFFIGVESVIGRWRSGCDSEEWGSHELGIGTVEVLSNMFQFRETKGMKRSKGLKLKGMTCWKEMVLVEEVTVGSW